MTFKHVPVLLNEAVDSLNINPKGVYVDCTLGGGGHTSKILSNLTSGHLYAFDQDWDAIKYNQNKLHNEIRMNQVTLIHDNFRNIRTALRKYSVTKVNGILYDLGVSSPQFDDAKRGFSYRKDSKLDMRMDQDNKLTAWIIVNKWSVHELIRIFFRYGDERFAKSIARRIKIHRADGPINTTYQLVKIIKEGIPAAARRHGGNPAKKVFQALRIAVNDELGALEESLESAFKLLALHGRISVITFEPLEDKLVKNMFKERSTIQDVPRGLPVIPDSLKPHFKLINRKPIRPTRAELIRNHRSHSARLRTIERIK
ncbi:MAG: 16S rRNA (cytosine(1402)-N(4))-methyltransferase RsmH [Acetilactobacillus jinshanensis]